MFALAGVPESWPVVVLKLAHDGLFAIEYVSVSPSASAAVGRKLYALFTPTDVAGVPEIVGARLPCVTAIENAGIAVDTLPSLTLIVIEANVPVAVGVPDKRPVDVLKDAQLGLFAIVKPSVSLFASLAVGWKL
jgi:hypothetical protein